MANKPKVQQDDVPAEGASPASNPEGRTPHGTPEDAGDHEAKGAPTNDRLSSETAPVNIEQGKQPPPKR